MTTVIVPILGGIWIASSAVLIGLLWRHRGHWFVDFSDLHQHEQQYHLKQEMVVRKIERVMKNVRSTVTRYINPIVEGVAAFIMNGYHRLVELEKQYRQKVRLQTISGPKRVEVITDMLDEAEKASVDQRWDVAEARYIGVLAMEKLHLRAYEGLGEVYWSSGQWKEALETYRFLTRLLKDKAPIGYFYRWAESARQCGKYGQAIKALQGALRLEPNQPRTLDLLVENAILHGNVAVAKEALETLKAANPDNNKIEDFERRIAEIGA